MVQLAARLILIQKVPRSSRGGASIFRRGTQAVYETGLENQRGWKSSVGSNPTLSAIIKIFPIGKFASICMIKDPNIPDRECHKVPRKKTWHFFYFGA